MKTRKKNQKYNGTDRERERERERRPDKVGGWASKFVVSYTFWRQIEAGLLKIINVMEDA